MAEQEVIKHTKKIFGIWQTKSSFWHKVSELLLEIFIIVFAITVSVYFHDRSELSHQRHETKEFLLGLRKDLLTDIEEMKQDKKSFIQSGNAFSYIGSRKLTEKLDPDTLNSYYGAIMNITGLVPNNGRFEGFKSAGKIGTIENTELQNNIMDLYQENIPNLLNSTDNYTSKKQALFEFLALHIKRLSDSTTNLIPVLSSDEAFNRCQTLRFTGEIVERYDACIQKINLIIKAINEEYGQEEK